VLVVEDDAALARGLSDHFRDEGFDVNACRLAYGFLYGRIEYSCEAPVFDQCVSTILKLLAGRRTRSVWFWTRRNTANQTSSAFTWSVRARPRR